MILSDGEIKEIKARELVIYEPEHIEPTAVDIALIKATANEIFQRIEETFKDCEDGDCDDIKAFCYPYDGCKKWQSLWKDILGTS